MADSNIIFCYKPEQNAIPGQVTYDGFDDGTWCTAQSFTCSGHRHLDSSEGAMMNRQSGTTSCGPVMLSRVPDSGSTALMKACFTGDPGPLTIKMLLQTKTGVDVYMTVECTEAIVEDYNISFDEQGSGKEHITMNYEQIDYEYAGRNLDGSTGDVTRAGYNRRTGKPVA